MDHATMFENATWRKASGSDSGGCVEVAFASGLIGVRDTKDSGNGPILAFTPKEWAAFLQGVDGGEFALDVLAR